eukprot:TRINITY_DN27098_c0_g1_i1.p1 TRINITY_DN27098_c0_g1~~TRINITY_DN27098_c0_g1_i1.p1  ORF type:complete len:375 (+),score=46.31 TRINITY_DN27098_c0_g1_i1:78-1202(+)
MTLFARDSAGLLCILALVLHAAAEATNHGRAIDGVVATDESYNLLYLFDWATKHGAIGMDHVRPTYFKKGSRMVRGLAATMDFAADGATVLGIPCSVVLYAEHPLVASSPIQKATTTFPSWLHMYGLPLILYLAMERRRIEDGGSSFWEPYISTLPTKETFAGFHMNYASKELLQIFSAMPAASSMRYMVQHLEERWEQNCEQWLELAEDAGVPNLIFEDFRWAVTVLQSRSFSVDWAEGPVLIPVLDLANSELTTNLEWPKSLSREGFVNCGVSGSVSEGEELLTNYVRGYCNGHVLHGYGFLVEDNPVSVVKLAPTLVNELQEVVNIDASQSPQPVQFANLQPLAREHCGLPVKRTQSAARFVITKAPAILV